MKLVWITDIHLNFVPDEQVAVWLRSVTDEAPDAILLGGDIGEADSVARYLQTLASAWSCPIYFVLGNHDFYRGSIAVVRRAIIELADEISNLFYLTDAKSPIPLAQDVGLIGHDGWADARVGDYMRSLVMMNDYRLIDELREHDKASRWVELQSLGDEAGEHIERMLVAAFESYNHVYLLTHVPPFREACWHQGAISNDEWAPHFTCMAVGHVIRDVMRNRPHKRLTVFCGHTHGSGTAQPLANVTVETGAAEYGVPDIARIWSLEA